MALKLKNNFNKLSDALLETRAKQIWSAMSLNASFPTPIPTVEQMEDIIGTYSNSLITCKSDDRFLIAEKNQRRAVVVENLHLWSYYVLQQSNGDIAKATTSGFSIAQERTPRPPLQKPASLEITPGINPGELFCKGKRVVGATSYLFEFTDHDGMIANSWQNVPATKTKQVISNLTPGVKYFCRMVALGTNNQLVYSDVTSRVAA